MIAASFLFFSVTKSIAADLSDLTFTVGLTGGAGLYAADGEERENNGGGTTQDVNPHKAYMEIGTAALFGEVTLMDRITLGVEYMPGGVETDISTDEKQDCQRGHINTSTCYNAADLGNVGINTVSAEFDNFRKIYVDVMIAGGMYVKGGFAEMDLNTKEDLRSGTTYGNTTMQGQIIGIGHRSTPVEGWIVKTEAIYENWDKVTLTDSNGVNQVSAKVDGIQARLSIGKSF